MTMDDLAVYVHEADCYLRAGESMQAAQSCLTAAGIARAIWQERAADALTEAAVTLVFGADDEDEDVR